MLRHDSLDLWATVNYNYELLWIIAHFKYIYNKSW